MKPLNPIMAVLVAAFVGAMPLRTLAADGKSVLDETGDKHPVNAMSKALQANAAARHDAGKRFESFLLDGAAGGVTFVKPDVDRVALGAVAREWAEKSAVGDVAVLYFVAGPGTTAPSWATDDPVLSKLFKPGRAPTLEARLRVYLEDWTTKNQIAATQEKSATTAFLNAAAAAATKVLSDVRTTRELDESVVRGDRPIETPVVDGSGGGNRRGSLPAAKYGFEALYHDGAEFGPVHGEGEGKRDISIKIFTRRDDNGSLVNELGVCDISDPNAPYCRRYSMQPGEKDIVIGGEGARGYKLSVTTVDGKRQVFLGRPDSKPGQPGTLNTSVEELLLARANQAAAVNRVRKVGDKEFYELPQGGGPGGLMLISKELVDGRSLANARNLRPELYASTAIRNKEGNTEDIEGKPHLGAIGDKEYHLELVDGEWEIKDGPGDKPKPAEPAGDGTTPAGDGTTTPGGTTGDGSWNTVQELEALLLTEGWARNEADMAEMDTALQSKYRIVYRKNANDALEYAVLVPKNLVAGGQLIYRSILKNEDGSKREPPMILKRVMGWKKYLILQFDEQQQYLDLTKPDEKNGFTMVGFLHKENGTVAARQFTDAEAMVDGMRRFSVVAEQDKPALTVIPERVKALAAGKKFTVEAYYTDKGLVGMLTFGDSLTQIWPREGPSGVADTPEAYAKLKGVANVFEGAQPSDDAPMPKDKLDDKIVALAVQTDIGLYVTKEVAGTAATPKKYYLMYRFKDGAADKFGRVKPFEAFSDDKDSRPLPKNYGMAGLVEHGDVIADHTAMGHGLVTGSTAARGVLAVYQNKQLTDQGTRKDGANCAGPVFWWGVADRNAALKICKDGKF